MNGIGLHTFSISLLAMGWNACLFAAKKSRASGLSAFAIARNVGLQNFMRPRRTPDPSVPVTHLAACGANSRAAGEAGSSNATS